MPRKTLITLTGEISEILASGKVGSLALTLDDKDVVLLLKAAVEREGSISAFGKRRGHRVETARLYLSSEPVAALDQGQEPGRASGAVLDPMW